MLEILERERDARDLREREMLEILERERDARDLREREMLERERERFLERERC